MRSLRDLLPYLRPYRTAVLVGLLLVLLSNAFNLLAPRLISAGIDAIGRPGATGRTLLTYASLTVAVAVLGGAARFGMRQILNGVSRRVETDLRDDFFRRLLALDAPFYGSTPTGEIISRATNDIQAIRMVAGPAYMYLVNMVVVSVFALSLMAWISPRMTLFAVLPMAALAPVTLAFGRMIHRQFDGIQQEFGRLSSLTQENLAGARIVKAYRQEAPQTESFRALSRGYLERNVEMVRTTGVYHPLLGMLAGLALAVTLLVGGRAILRGEITIGQFIEFSLYLAMLGWPMISLGWVVNLFQRGAASMSRVSAVLRAEPSVRPPANPLLPPRIRGELELRGVSFRYPGTERWVLRDLSFTIPAGATAAVVGSTGAGKSTLVALLTRQYDPQEGEVLLDGVPLNRWPLDRLREIVALVPQESFLFSTTLRENLSLGFHESDPARAEARILAAARVAKLEETLAALPRGLDTLLGERGVNLSGGQKQRATLARAIARDPRVLLLDDALSAVDTHTEAEILRGLQDVLRARTSIVVSHRVTAVMNADLILVLEDGRLVESGSHEPLLARGGIYARLQRRQLLSETLEQDLDPCRSSGRDLD